MDPEVLRQKVYQAFWEHQNVYVSRHSYDTFLLEWLPKMIEQYGTINETIGGVPMTFRFVRPRVQCTHYTPKEAIESSMTYAATVYVDISITSGEGDRWRHKLVQNHALCTLPITAMSAPCRWRIDKQYYRFTDPLMADDTFVIKGFVTFIPRASMPEHNRTFLFPRKETSIAAVEIRSEHPDRKHRSTSTTYVRMTAPQTTFDKRSHRGFTAGSKVSEIVVDISYLSTSKKPRPVPVAVLATAMGCSVGQFCDMIRTAARGFWDESMQPYLDRVALYEYSPHCDSTDTAQECICKMYEEHSGKEKTRASLLKTIYSEVLPHMNTDENMLSPGVLYDTNMQKTYHLAYCSALLMRYAADQSCTKASRDHIDVQDDRDSYSSLFVHDAAERMAGLFRTKFTADKAEKPFMYQSRQHVRKQLFSADWDFTDRVAQWLFNHVLMTRKIGWAMGSGRFSEANDSVTADMNSGRVVNKEYLIHNSRRIKRNVPSTQYRVMRAQHPSAMGIIGPGTPEGKQGCGLSNMLALTCVQSQEITDQPHWETLRFYLGETFTPISKVPSTNNQTKVFDGMQRWKGWTTLSVVDTVNLIRSLRRQGVLHAHTGVYARRNEVTMSIIRGRLLRPLIVLDKIQELHTMLNGIVQPDWKRLILSGCVEYIGPQEEYGTTVPECRIVPLYRIGDREQRHTHLELTDASMMGMNMALQPFPNHNAGARNTYWVNMVTQSIPSQLTPGHMFGVASTYISHYNQAPLVKTQVSRQTSFEDAQGFCAVVAIGSFSRGQEDGLIVKQEFLDRMAVITNEIRVDVNLHPIHVLCNPKKNAPGDVIGMQSCDYSQLGDDGVIKEGAHVNRDTILVGLVAPAKSVGYGRTSKVRVPRALQGGVDERGAVHYQDVSTRFQTVEGMPSGRVIKVDRTPGHIRIIVSVPHKTRIGDKFSSRQGQKGVLTGIYPQVNLPMVATGPSTGMVPDILISAESLVSRMTMAKLWEFLLSLAAAVTGDVQEWGVDPQIMDERHSKKRLHDVMQALKENGFSPDGTVTMRDGTTGDMIGRYHRVDGSKLDPEAEGFDPDDPSIRFEPTNFTMGPLQYVFLSHLSTKANGRGSDGPIDAMTRQPRGGRKKRGGMRNGPMEFDALCTAGMVNTILERTTTTTDDNVAYICNSCGRFVDIANRRIRTFFCKRCQSRQGIREVKLATSTILLFKRMLTMGVDMRYTLRDLGPEEQVRPF